MKYQYKTNGVCSSHVEFEINGDTINGVRFAGGCDGNLKGLGVLLEGMTTSDAAKRLAGINCKGRGTSCPDQLSKAISRVLYEKAEKG